MPCLAQNEVLEVSVEYRHSVFFTYVQDGKERRNMIPILPHEKIFVTYKLAKLVFSEVSQIKKIRVNGFVAYFVESHKGMRGVYIDKEFKLR